MMALHIWATAHGIASLFGRGDPGRRPLPMTPEELLEAAILIYLRGLGLPDGPPPSPEIQALKSSTQNSGPGHSEMGRAPYLWARRRRLDSRDSSTSYVNVINIHGPEGSNPEGAHDNDREC